MSKLVRDHAPQPEGAAARRTLPPSLEVEEREPPRRLTERHHGQDVAPAGRRNPARRMVAISVVDLDARNRVRRGARSRIAAVTGQTPWEGSTLQYRHGGGSDPRVSRLPY